jgi:O-antigen ligase
VCAIGFAVDWLDRRGVSGLSFGRFILATTALPALCFAYALASADRGRRALGWLIVAALIAAILLVTGTRSNLGLAFGLVGVIGLRKGSGIHPVRLVLYVTGMVGALATLVPWLASHLISDPAFLNGRITQALAVVNGDASSDQSYLARQHSYEIAHMAWQQNRWFGVGPGGILGSDAPWLVLAKFGLMGASALALFGVGLLISIRRTRRLAGPQPIHAAVRGWALILLALTPFGPWTEDKGLGLAVALLVTAVVAQVKTAIERPGSSEMRSSAALHQLVLPA